MHRPNRRQVAAVIAGAVVAFCFAGSLLAALHSPRPRDLPLGLTGSPVVTDRIATELDQHQSGAFEIHRYDDAALAERAVRHREVVGAFVADTTSPRLIVAGGNGLSSRQVLETAFEAVTAAQGQHLVVDDVAPLPTGDRAGASSFLLTVGLLAGSLLAASLFALSLLRVPAIERRIRGALAGAVVIALAVGGVCAWLVDGIAGALTGHALEVYGACALFSFAVAATVFALAQWIGPVGIPLAGLVFLIVGVPAAGGAIGGEFVPSTYQWLAGVLPPPAQVNLLRRITYFDGNGTDHALMVLGCWAVAAILLLLAAPVFRRSPAAASRPSEDAVAVPELA